MKWKPGLYKGLSSIGKNGSKTETSIIYIYIYIYIGVILGITGFSNLEIDPRGPKYVSCQHIEQ